MGLRIFLLGQASLSRDGEPIDLPGQKPLALLSYLLLQRQAQRREHLIDLLFDYPDDPQASLRWTLSKLRKAIGGEYLLADRQPVGFNFHADFWLDVFAFEAGETGLYRGDLLAGLHLRDAARFDDWLLFERQRLRGVYQARLEAELAEQQRQGDPGQVILTAQQLLQLDELREDWHAALMEAYARQGKRAAALERYEKLRLALHRELGSEPAPETVRLAEAIRSGQVGAPLPVTGNGAGQPGPGAAAATAAAALADPGGAGLLVGGAGASAPGAAAPTVGKAVSGAPASGISAAGNPAGVAMGRPALGLLVGMLVLGLVALLSSTPGLWWQRWPQLRTRLAGGPGEPAGPGAAGALPYAGASVSILGHFQDDQALLFQQSILPLEKTSGIDVLLIPGDETFDLELDKRLESPRRPDIVILPQPGWLRKLQARGQIVDLGTFLDPAYLQRQYPETLMELVTVDGQVLAIWHNVDIKSLVWYPRQAFEAKGYQPPETWDELMALTAQIAADGGVPWCIGNESGEASGWPGSDWVEDILLRTAPPESYDAWVRHELPFNSPEVRRAFEIMGQIWLNDAYVYGGRAGVLKESFFDSPTRLFEQPPACYLHRQASFVRQYFPPQAVFGRDYDFFYLPPIDPAYGKPVLGSGKLLVMVNDRPEVREVVRYLTTAASMEAMIKRGGFYSPHRDVPLAWYPGAGDLRFMQILLEADTYRFDGSDLMPESVGLGSFLQGINAWVAGEDLETVLEAVDASWPK